MPTTMVMAPHEYTPFRTHKQTHLLLSYARGQSQARTPPGSAAGEQHPRNFSSHPPRLPCQMATLPRPPQAWSVLVADGGCSRPQQNHHCGRRYLDGRHCGRHAGFVLLLPLGRLAGPPSVWSRRPAVDAGTELEILQTGRPVAV